MTTKKLLLAIDVQNDFCHPEGALFVPGASEDVSRLSNFLHQHRAAIDTLILTQDAHQVMDIAHAAFWTNAQGQHPNSYTNINYQDVAKGKWIPYFEHKRVEEYLKKLENQNEFPHTIWPQHCIDGSWGAAIADEFMHAVMAWAAQGRYTEMIRKGMHPLTEHFGALRANVPADDDISTSENKRLLKLLDESETIYIAGEARSHCVANTMKQIMDYKSIIKKTILLTDCMSNVPGFETIADPIYQKALALGAIMVSSTDVII